MENKRMDRVRNNTSTTSNKQIDEITSNSIKLHIDNKSQINEQILKLSKEWDIERWLETNASLIALIGVLLGYFVNIYWLILPFFVLLFLFQHAIQGWCPPIPVFRRFKVRTQKEIDEEIYALKAVRGDFNDLNSNSVDSILNALRK